jgi:2-polyprenyl-3-methyl-5-hydroxy-6-metoxy-1,4-benzoquinol methylase
MNPNAHERSTEITHKENPNQEKYDWAYYNALMPFITGYVLDIGAGAGMFAKEYAKKEEVEKVYCIDKYTEQLPELDKIIKINWVCPEKLPVAGKFETIVSTEFIEHIEREQLEPLLEQIKEQLHEGGVFVGSTPNKQVSTTNPYHLYEYTLSELTEIFEKYFSDVKTWDTNVDFCTVWVCKK